MKTRIAILLLTLGCLISCKQPDKLPPLNSGYATKFIMPDPVDLSAEDRAYLQELQEEYTAATGESI